MNKLVSVMEQLDGVAWRWELRSHGISGDMIDVLSRHPRFIFRVRKGLYALVGEHPEAVRAWRIGGRLTCISAAAFHAGETMPPVLHVEVAANTPRLRDPVRSRAALSPNAPVVIHWARRPGPGGRRAVSAEHAEAVATVCGTRAGQAAAVSASASRIV